MLAPDMNVTGKCFEDLKKDLTEMLQVVQGLSADSASRSVSFSRMRSEGSRFTWGSGGEAVFAKFCVRNRSQPFATVRNRLREGRKALHSGECVWSAPESVSN